jgi:hypothetical protein
MTIQFLRRKKHGESPLQSKPVNDMDAVLSNCETGQLPGTHYSKGSRCASDSAKINSSNEANVFCYFYKM